MTRVNDAAGARLATSRARRAQALGEAEPQGFSDLAHGSTGTGHRHLSWGDVNAFQASVTGPERLTPGLPTTLPRGWPFPPAQRSPPKHDPGPHLVTSSTTPGHPPTHPPL